MWEAQLEALSGYEVRTPALTGRGDSMDGWADELLAENPGDLVVAGASMGGYCALALADRAPDRLKGLALVGSRASADFGEAKAGRDRSRALVREKGVAALWETTRDYVIGPDPDPALSSRLDRIVSRQQVEEVTDELAAMRDRPDRTHVVRELRCPFLAFAGERDEAVVEESKKLVELAADGELVVVAGASHLVGFTHPGAVDPVLLRFVERCLG
jgi:pimeloyl-ACP methyl ester carboxylesterase